MFASKRAHRAHLTSGFIDGMQVCQDPAHLWRVTGEPVLVQGDQGQWVLNRHEPLDQVRDRLRAALSAGWDAALRDRRCQVCDQALGEVQASARYCSPACRQRASRARRGATVAA